MRLYPFNLGRWWTRGLVLIAGLIVSSAAFSQNTPCPSSSATGANVDQAAQSASQSIKQVEAQRKEAQAQVENIQKGDPIDNAANLLDQFSRFHLRKKPQQKTEAVASVPCNPAGTANGAAAANLVPAAQVQPAVGGAPRAGAPVGMNAIPGSGLIYSDTRTSQVDQAYKRGNAYWWFPMIAPVHGRPVVTALLINDTGGTPHFVPGVLAGYDAAGNAYLNIVSSPDGFAAGKKFKVDSEGNSTEVSSIPPGVSMPSSTKTAEAEAQNAGLPVSVTPLNDGKCLVSFTPPGRAPMGIVMQKLNDGSAQASNSSDGVYRDARYVIVVHDGLATVNTVHP